MENLNKIYPTKISHLADGDTLFDFVKTIFYKLLPLAKPVFWIGLSGALLLILQIGLVGVFDRWGVSPKISLIGSSLFYVIGFAGLALLAGGLKKNEISKDAGAEVRALPICKRLIIKRKKQEIHI